MEFNIHELNIMRIQPRYRELLNNHIKAMYPNTLRVVSIHYVPTLMTRGTALESPVSFQLSELTDYLRRHTDLRLALNDLYDDLCKIVYLICCDVDYFKSTIETLTLTGLNVDYSYHYHRSMYVSESNRCRILIHDY